MASIISAGTTSATALNMSADTTGILQLASNNGTVALTIGTDQVASFAAAMSAPSVTFSNFGSATTAVVALGDGNTGLFRPAAQTLGFTVNGAERARIDSSGNLLVGTTTIHLYGARVAVSYAGGPSGAVGQSFRPSIDGGYPLYFFNAANSPVGNIQTSSTTTSYNTSSDYRLKNTIAPMTGALAKVALLKPCTYKWKVDGSDGQGFIAHELQEVVEGCVTGEKDAVETYMDEDGVEQTRPKYQGIDTSFLVATLTAAIQELNAKVTALENK